MTNLREIGFLIGLGLLIEHKFNAGDWLTLGQTWCHGTLGLVLVNLFIATCILSKKRRWTKSDRF